MTEQEINEAVARKLGYRQNEFGMWYSPGSIPEVADDLPEFDTDISAAWEIIEFFQENHDKYGYPSLFMTDPDEWMFDLLDGDCGTWAPFPTAKTAPMAICLAFLKLSESVSTTPLDKS